MRIGIFDSGIGGLNFLKEIRRTLPQFDYVYFGDSKNFPYGDKSQNTIYELTKKSLEFLFKKDCKIVILACNTASSWALRKIQQEWIPKYYPDRKVLGVLIPIAEEIANKKYIKKVGVVGTKATILARAYERELLKINKNLYIETAISSNLVNMIEKKDKYENIKYEIKNILNLFNNKIDALILGCTHYSFIKKDFKNIFPNIYISNMEKTVALKFKDYLNKHKEIKKFLSTNKTSKIFFSGNEFKNKKITLIGLGLIGRGVATSVFLAKKGANLTITDLKNKKELKTSLEKLKKFKNIKYILGKHRENDFKNVDMILQNPSVAYNSYYLKIARKNNIPIETDITIFFKSIPKNVVVIGITGSKGKSTTTALIYEVLKSKFKEKVLLGGNLVLNKSPLNLLNKIQKNSKIVLELSSWDLKNLGEYNISPNISVVTNIIPDHLNKYKNIEEYEEDKKNIFKYQKKDDILFLNKNDEKLKKLKTKINSKLNFFDGTSKDVAIKIGKIFGISKKNSLKIIKNFNGLEHRQEFVREYSGVKFYNDSASTIPDSTIKAINDLKPKIGKLVLISGGVDKKLDYKNLSEIILKNKNNLKLILLPGTASEKIKKYFKNLKYKFIEVESLKQAVNEAVKISKNGDIVVLSPASTSFNLFKNEFDRGNQFKKLVLKYA